MFDKTALDRLISFKTKSGIYPYQLDISLYIADGILIDAGSGNILSKTKRLLDEVKIHSTVITHIHEDHTGAASWIKENLKVPVYIHKNSIPEASVKSSVPLYRRMVWGNRDAFTADPVPSFIQSDKYRLDVIESPGHHRDHLVFHEKQMGWLFTGDLYVSRRQLIAFKDENISDAIESMQRLLKLDFDTIFCGHSGIQKNGKDKLKSKLEYFIEIQGRVKILQNKGLSLHEIDRQIFPGMDLWTVLSRGEWSSYNIIKTI